MFPLVFNCSVFAMFLLSRVCCGTLRPGAGAQSPGFSEPSPGSQMALRTMDTSVTLATTKINCVRAKNIKWAGDLSVWTIRLLISLGNIHCITDDIGLSWIIFPRVCHLSGENPWHSDHGELHHHAHPPLGPGPVCQWLVFPKSCLKWFRINGDSIAVKLTGTFSFSFMI